MGNEKPLINIPENAEITPTEVKDRFDRIDKILVTVVVAVVIALISIVISVTGIFLDQLRYNNAAYKEYSEKTKSVETTQKINQELLDQNKKNQEIIIELNKQLLKNIL